MNNIEKIFLHEFTEKAYLDYANYVIKDRALPSIGDGLKPVQRRIIYAMFELNLKATTKYKKSARTVGDVLGKFHPHGDTACYEAMVLMAQAFSYRYPIIDGQGNWGAPEDPKSFAAMRYTEARLSKYANILLAETGMGTVNWEPNFDGTLLEPIELPARLPNILLNGATGIAVGMTTDIPPHNINEVVKACITLIDEPQTNNQKIYECIQGPDFPTGGEIITPEKEIADIYSRGNGTIRIRAIYELKEKNIIITALPYQVSPLKIVKQIITQVINKKIPDSLTIRDESDHENPIRLTIVPPKSTKSINKLMSHLFATTELEKTFRVNMNIIGINGNPEVKNLIELLKEWIVFRKQTVKKRLKYKLEKVKASLEILEGLLIAHVNTSKIVYIIQNEDNPKKIIKKNFNLSNKQTESILDLKLRNLARLEEIKINSEQDELIKEKFKLEKVLNSKLELKALIKKELQSDARKYGDKRRTTVVLRKKAQAFAKTDLVSPEPITVILSKNGWVNIAKGLNINNKKLLYKPGDQYLDADSGLNNEMAVFLNSSGRVYALYPNTLPSIRGYGEPLTGRFETPSGSIFNSVLICGNKTQMFVSNSNGYGFITRKGIKLTTSIKGKTLLISNDISTSMPAIKVRDIKTDSVAAITNNGRLLIFPLNEMPELTCGKGSKFIQVDTQKESVTKLKLISLKEEIIVFAGKQYFRINQKNISRYTGVKGSIGKELPRGFRNVTRVKIQPQKH